MGGVSGRSRDWAVVESVAVSNWKCRGGELVLRGSSNGSK